MSKRIFDTARQLAGSKQAWVAAVCLSLLVTLPFLHGQRGGRGGYGNSQVGIPTWEVDPEFKNDVFTFARVQYSSYGGRGSWGRGGGRRGGGGWATDYPDAELNLAYRLQQMTSMKVSPEPVVVTLEQEDLEDYPFLYIVEAGRLSFQENEVPALREYLLNGGFVMFDDFWGAA